MKPFTESNDCPPLLSAKVSMITILKNGIRMLIILLQYFYADNTQTQCLDNLYTVS